MQEDKDGNLLDNGTIVVPAEERTRCEVWTRVMGYHRPIAAANAGKQQEFRDRQNFSVDAPKTACAMREEQAIAAAPTSTGGFHFTPMAMPEGLRKAA